MGKSKQWTDEEVKDAIKHILNLDSVSVNCLMKILENQNELMRELNEIRKKASCLKT